MTVLTLSTVPAVLLPIIATGILLALAGWYADRRRSSRWDGLCRLLGGLIAAQVVAVVAVVVAHPAFVVPTLCGDPNVPLWYWLLNCL